MEEMACAIAEAQAALFAGRFRDLECCAARLLQLCDSLKKHRCESDGKSGVAMGDVHLASRVHQENKVFAAVLVRMRRHLDALRGLLNGPSLMYQPKSMTLPERKN
jgi:hypothetical protein